MNPLKLYVVVREEFQQGFQIAQAIHAFREFVEHHKEVESNWYKESNTIVVLKTSKENLDLLVEKAKENNFSYSIFKEPDIENETTAVAFGPESKEILKKIKLAG